MKEDYIFMNSKLDQHMFAAIKASSELASTYIANRQAERDQLYDILQHIYSVGNEMADQSKTSRQRREILDDYIALYEIPVNKRTSLYGKIAKVIFHKGMESQSDCNGKVSYFDNKKLSTYNRVLKCAVEAKVKSSDLAQWIKDQGGISVILNGKSADKPDKNGNAAGNTNYSSIAVSHLKNAAPFTTANIKGLSLNSNELSLLIARLGDGGKVELVHEIKEGLNHSGFNSLMSQLGKTFDDEAKKAAKVSEKKAVEESELEEMAALADENAEDDTSSTTNNKAAA